MRFRLLIRSNGKEEEVKAIPNKYRVELGVLDLA
jgi:hypothetical protein